MKYSLRTLLMVLALGPMVLAGVWRVSPGLVILAIIVLVTLLSLAAIVALAVFALDALKWLFLGN